MKYDNLFDYDFIREMKEAGHFIRRAFVIPEEEEIHPILGMLGVVDNEEDLIEEDDDKDVPEEVLDEYYYWEIDHFFADENFFDEYYDYLYEIDNLFKYEYVDDKDKFILIEIQI